MRRGWQIAAFVALTAATTAGCVHADTEVLATSATPQPGAGAALPTAGWDEHRVGDRVTTRSGSTVIVHRMAVDTLPGGERVAGADVEACAPRSRTGATPVGPAYFLLQTADGTSRKPAAVAGWRSPELTDRALAPGECTRGWIAFRLRTGDEPVATLLASSSFVRWTR